MQNDAGWREDPDRLDDAGETDFEFAAVDEQRWGEREREREGKREIRPDSFWYLGVGSLVEVTGCDQWVSGGGSCALLLFIIRRTFQENGISSSSSSSFLFLLTVS